MTSRTYAVLGYPIEHSLSPFIHRAAYEVLGLDWQYERYPVKESELGDFVYGEGNHHSGFSLTMPLKFEAAKLATTREPLVARLGLANTLVRESDELHAYNTDVFGITKALCEVWGTDIHKVAILGAGATALSALASVLENKPEAEINVYARDLAKARKVLELAAIMPGSVNVYGLSDFGSDQELTINTIPSNSLGFSNNQQSGWLLDVNYSNPDQDFVSTFNPNKVISGKQMLLWQAVAQIRIFLNADAGVHLPNELEVLEAMQAAL